MIYNWLIRHRRWAYGILGGFLIFTILIYAFKSWWLARFIYEYIIYWSTALSAAFMLVLAYMAYISISENRRIREEEKEHTRKEHSLEVVKHWIDDVIRIRVECATYTDDIGERIRRERYVSQVRALVPYIVREAFILQSFVSPSDSGRSRIAGSYRIDLQEKIHKISEVLKQDDVRSLSNEKNQEELNTQINEALVAIGDVQF